MTKKATRQMVPVCDELGTTDDVLDKGTIANLVAWVSELQDEYGEEAQIQLKSTWSDSSSFVVVTYRQETDAELNRRIKRERRALEKKKEAAARKKRQELRELARLEKKYRQVR